MGRKSGKWQISATKAEPKALFPYTWSKTGLTFREAILDLSAIFNITDEINRSVNRPDVRRQPATVEQTEGSWDKDINQGFYGKGVRDYGAACHSWHTEGSPLVPG